MIVDSWTQRLLRPFLFVVLVAAGASFPGAGAITQPAAATADPAASGELAPVMLVLDASGSMKESDPSGGTRMDAAKGAITGLVEDAPEDAELGLTVYGASPGKAQDVKKLGCKDVKTVAPVGAVGSAGLKQAVDRVEPGGFTPIGRSLRKAAKGLPAEGPRSVILVSDGEDTCAPPPPCEVAKDLKKQGVDLTMHTVGFRVGKKAREELRCIADIGGGSYVDAPDADTLESELPSIAERAFRNYKLEGEPITGTDEPDGAPEIAPGQWVDTIDAGQTKHYALEVPDGFRVHAAATAVLPRDESAPYGNGGELTLATRILDKQGNECALAEPYLLSWRPIITAALSWKSSAEQECKPGEEMYLTVNRTGPKGSKYPAYDMELLVMLEPPLEGDAGPAPNGVLQRAPKPASNSTPVVGGGSFNDATELPGSGTYTDDVRYGEMATYKVWLDWGEAMSLQVETGKGSTESLRAEAAFVYANIYNPIRMQGAEFEWNTYDAETLNAPVKLDPLRMPSVVYRNRQTESSDVGTASLPGWYYVTVDLERDKSTRPVPISIHLGVGGKKTDGPEYAEIDGYPSEPVAEDPEGAGGESTSEESGDPEDESSDSPGNATGEQASGSGADDPQATADDGAGVLPWVIAGSFAALLLIVIALTTAVVRRRPTGK